MTTILENSETLIVLGSGETTGTQYHLLERIESKKFIALQRVFPECYESLNIIPDYWTWFDPNGSIAGMKKILENPNNEDFKKIIILLPHYITGTYDYYRQYAGTTQLGHPASKWEAYLNLLDKIKKVCRVEVIPCTTMKNIKNFPDQNKDFSPYDLSGEDYYLRFVTGMPIFGTVEYDSETVYQMRYKWGLENKLSSSIFPLAYHMGATDLLVVGFDLKGGRFYDKTKSRHAWGTDVKRPNEAVNFSLSVIRQWVGWAEVHKMKIRTLSPPTASFLNLVLPQAILEQ